MLVTSTDLSVCARAALSPYRCDCAWPYTELMAAVAGSAVVPMDADSGAAQPRPPPNGSAEEGRLRGADPTPKMPLAPSAIVQQAAAEALDQRCVP